MFQYGFVDTADIRFSQEVRGMCEVNTCRQYGKTWACPPAIGTVEECRARVQRYDRMLVFSVKYDLEDSFDYEGMVAGMQQFKETCRILHEGLRGQVGTSCFSRMKAATNARSARTRMRRAAFPTRRTARSKGMGYSSASWPSRRESIISTGPIRSRTSGA